MNYDLEERTKNFSKNMLRFLKIIHRDKLNENIINQLIRSGTSVGVNYCEANGASSKKDFRNKIHICRKEIQETKYWIELLNEVVHKKYQNDLRRLWKEPHELTLIFNKISTSLNN